LIQKSGRKSTILNFRDQSIKTGKFLIDLLYALKPRRIDWSLVGAGDTPDTQELNAKYAISIARQAGCCIFCLWEDIVEVKPKMVFMFVGTLMAMKFDEK